MGSVTAVIEKGGRFTVAEKECIYSFIKFVMYYILRLYSDDTDLCESVISFCASPTCMCSKLFLFFP